MAKFIMCIVMVSTLVSVVTAGDCFRFSACLDCVDADEGCVFLGKIYKQSFTVHCTEAEDAAQGGFDLIAHNHHSCNKYFAKITIGFSLRENQTSKSYIPPTPTAEPLFVRKRYDATSTRKPTSQTSFATTILTTTTTTPIPTFETTITPASTTTTTTTFTTRPPKITTTILPTISTTASTTTTSTTIPSTKVTTTASPKELDSTEDLTPNPTEEPQVPAQDAKDGAVAPSTTNKPPSTTSDHTTVDEFTSDEITLFHSQNPTTVHIEGNSSYFNISAKTHKNALHFFFNLGPNKKVNEAHPTKHLIANAAAATSDANKEEAIPLFTYVMFAVLVALVMFIGIAYLLDLP